MPHPYTKNLVSTDSIVETKDSLKFGVEGGIPIKIRKDGTIEARGFSDVDDKVNLASSGGKIFNMIKVSDSVSSVTDVTSGQTIFTALKSYYLKFVDTFAVHSLPIFRYSHVVYPKFNFLGKKIKRMATKIIGGGSKFIFYFKKSDKVYAEKTSINFPTKIYTVPIKLKFADSFRSLNDLVIVKTGAFIYEDGTRIGFASGSERVVYVSPHEELSGTAYHKTTGNFAHIQINNSYSTFSGASGNGDFLSPTTYYYLSSKNYEFPSGYTLSGGAVYNKVGQDGSISIKTGSSSLKDTLYYSTYTGALSKTKVNTGIWNGVIPAYTPFKIEVWSVNAEAIGFDGNIEIAPHSGYLNLNIEVLGSAFGTAESANAAENQAAELAKFSCYKKVDSALVKIGATPSGSRLRKYVKFIESQTNL